MRHGWVSEDGDGVLLSIVVQPRASRNQIVGVQGGELKLRLTSPPVEGAANRACCAFLAKLLGVAKGEVALVSGERSRHKRLRIAGLSAGEVVGVLGTAEKT